MSPVQVKRIKTSSLLHIVSRGFSPVFSFLILILCYNPGVCCALEQLNNKGLVPSNFLKWGKWGADYVVLVDKSEQKVMLYRSDNLLEPEKVYQCSTGENGGPKSVINDKKTPEGIYYFINTYTKDSLAPIYGVMALPLNYPNIFDVKAGKNGYGIWFHGLNKPLKPYDTSGCVALVNKDIEDLASYITLNSTPVIISSNIRMVTQEELEEKANEIADIIEGWRDSWQNKDIEKYMSYYSLSFKSGSKNWSQIKDYKTRLTKKYKEIKVEVDDLGILINDNVVIASFKQTYRTPVFESSGAKRLYITKNSDEWKIIDETFSIAEAKKVDGTSPLQESPIVAAVDKEDVPLATAEPEEPRHEEHADIKTDEAPASAPENEESLKAAVDAIRVALAAPEPDAGQDETPETKGSDIITPLPDSPRDAVVDEIQVASTTQRPGVGKEDPVDTKQVDEITTLPDNPQEEVAEAEQVSATALQPDNPLEKIKGFINSWIGAWEAKDAERYIAFYDAGFRSDGMNLDAWKRHKNRLNKRYNSINVEISDLNITMVSDDQAEVTFIQDYMADGYADYGVKSMVLIKKGEEWKIKKEEWKAISR